MSDYAPELMELVEKVIEQEQGDRERAAERLEQEAFANEELQIAITESWIQLALKEVARRRALASQGRKARARDREPEEIADRTPPPDTRGLVAMGERNLLDFVIAGKRLGDMRRPEIVKARKRQQHLARWLQKIETRLPEDVRVRDQFDHRDLEDLLERARGME